MKDRILIFIPMYNCEKQIVRVLDQFHGEICDFISEVIIVNNRSTDQGEDAVIRRLGQKAYPFPVKLLRNKENYGLGGSHKVAFDYAVRGDFDYVIVLHGDDQGCIQDFLPILRRKEYRKYDCCLGSRFSRQSRLEGYSRFRTFGNRIYNLIFSAAIGKRICDLGAGLNMYSVKALRSGYYHQYPDNLMFNCFMLFAMDAYGQTYRFIPISWREDDQVSNVKMVTQALKTFAIAVKYFGGRRKFLEKDHREKQIRFYRGDLIFEGGKKDVREEME